MPPIVETSLAIIEAAIAAAPTVKKIYDDAAKLFDMWFGSGLISVDQQAKLKAWSEDNQARALRNERPTAWVVDAPIAQA